MNAIDALRTISLQTALLLQCFSCVCPDNALRAIAFHHRCPLCPLTRLFPCSPSSALVLHCVSARWQVYMFSLVPRDSGSLNGTDSLIPQGVFIDVLVKDGMTIEVFPADLPENGNIRWALDAVLVLDFFHDEGAASRARRPRRSVSAR